MLAPYTGTAYLFLPVGSGLLQLFGIDHWLTITAHFSMAMLTFFAVSICSRIIWRPFAALSAGKTKTSRDDNIGDRSGNSVGSVRKWPVGSRGQEPR